MVTGGSMRRKKHQQIAAQVMVFFAEYRLSFQELTLFAQEYFEAADWRAIQKLASERIDLYSEMVREASLAIIGSLEEKAYRSRREGYTFSLGLSFY